MTMSNVDECQSGPSKQEGFALGLRKLVLQFLRRLGLMGMIPAVACQSIGTVEGALPDAIRSTRAVVVAAGYPDLSKIPTVPVNLPSEKDWIDFESDLLRDVRRLSFKAGAPPLSQLESTQAWASQVRSTLEASHMSAPIDPSPSDATSWAAKARASIEAGIARLQPN
ncbi:hypothetical protein [Candidatus Phycosocius spiralis]|uniref:Uncharacterized protein n=1 Tax=Candidatus Phycosocius spiralis TaxID=2815099 RepID=A0ABQ4PS74_9PROT|nr:hypothetical protein [Candidatus Phycosocius spiralis]GIU65872.1 hypothetical protein PsB1_0026 [Candidatus Phycosocius spiralis]